MLLVYLQKYKKIPLKDYFLQFYCFKSLKAGVAFQDYLATIPPARRGSESIAHKAESGMRYSLTRGYEREGNNCFCKMQLIGQKRSFETNIFR